MASRPVNYVSRSFNSSLVEAYLGFARTLLDISAFEDTIKFEAAVLVDRREGVEVEMCITDSRSR